MKRFAGKSDFQAISRPMIAFAIVAGIAFCGTAFAAFVPPSGNTLWLDAGSITSVSSGAAVQSWADISGNSHNFVQNDNVINAPTYIASGLNGKAVLRFDGNTDGTGDGLYLDTASTWRPSISGLTVFAVLKNTSGGWGTQGWWGNGNGRVAFGANTGDGYAPTSSFTAWTPNAMSTYGSASSLNTSWNVQAYTMNDATESNWAWYYNGDKRGSAQLTEGDPADYTTSDRLWVGYSGTGNEVWKGDVAEIIAFDHVLSDADRTSVTSYLQTKYNTPMWRTPTAVPFSSGPAYPGGSSPDPTYAADKAVDGDLTTFCVLSDDSLTGSSSETFPVNGSDPVTGHMVFNLGGVYQVDGAKMFSRLAADSLGPANVDFYLSDKNGNDRGLLKSYTYSEIMNGAFENVYWDPVVAQYIGMRVNSSYESGPTYFNFQIAEMQFSTQAIPEPSTLVMATMGLFGLVAYAWRKRK